jgi:hypothetical protein
MSRTARTDGSSVRDREQPVRIDRSQFAQRHRYTCPEGHSNWAPTNNHLWCQTCRRQYEHGRDVDPEHYHVVDQVTGEEITWARVELVV